MAAFSCTWWWGIGMQQSWVRATRPLVHSRTLVPGGVQGPRSPALLPV